MSDVDVAALDAALKQVLADLANRPLSGALVLAYWLVMTNMLMEIYEVDESGLSTLYAPARALHVKVADARTALN